MSADPGTARADPGRGEMRAEKPVLQRKGGERERGGELTLMAIVEQENPERLEWRVWPAAQRPGISIGVALLALVLSFGRCGPLAAAGMPS